MMAKKAGKTVPPGALSGRLHFSEDEKRLPWLPLLLDAHAVADKGVETAIREEEKRRGRRLACSKGCGNCCKHQTDLPVYPHELIGIHWYVVEKMDSSERAMLKERLASHRPESPCPFLIDGSCSIHPLRPIGCRMFNVFGAACFPGEDPFFTRRDDVLNPLTECTDQAFALVSPVYEVQGTDLAGAVRFIRTQIMNLHACDWNKLVAKISRKESEECAR